MDSTMVNIVHLLLPNASAGVTNIVSYGLFFILGAVVMIPAVALWIRKNFPEIIAFMLFWYDKVHIAEKSVIKDKSGIDVPLMGIEKREYVLTEARKALLDPNNNIVTKKTLRVFNFLSGAGKTLGNVLEFALPIAKVFIKK